ncbi:Ubiquitin-conjugating enzyme E2 J1 [Schistosoma haematobium]|uniref:Ubiquitin-conjugating enzyme E2 J1 n=2 Tax=Schistosoma haematobium TaxID=6185 RepID=A0A922IL70_SCHHA|nr:Ubiquitin-conjugating enzyme E2 J1 [Schistosoma haematobium]KAH9581839.1 Ubiquitin-conjugating enzyme E2 J1 [Schistosoma haematobium]CAH8612873.1 unnamed protein product [Schistosoma haematobium]CAH8620567.1 unnamed protein product [Schistosoma haematobium]
MVVTYNSRNPAVKRLMKEAQELSEPTELYFAKPLEDNLFEWHFTIRGPEDSDFQGGLYHGRILLPSEYPMKPPNIVLLTPNGRFEIHRKICLSISGYHPESWRPSWSIRTALLALIGFMPTHGVGAIGSLNQPKEERQLLARKSQSYVCSICGPTNNLLLPLTTASSSMNKEASEAAAQISMMSEEEFRNKKAFTNSNTPTTTTTTTANNNDHHTNSLSGITSQSNLSSGNLINPSLTPSTSSFTTPFPMPSLSSPTQSNTANIAENMNSYLWTGFPSYMYPYRNENIPPQIAYWLCFPVYYPVSPFPMNASSSSSVATGLNSITDSGTASGERVPLSFGEWLKEIREKEKSASTSVQDTVSPSSSSSTTTTTIIDTTQVTYISHSNENIKPTTSKTLSPANQSKEVVDSSENQVHTITETVSSQNKNESDTKELSSSSITDKSPEYDSMKQTNSHEHKVPDSPLVDGGTSSKTIDNSNTIETNESCKENKSETQKTDRLHHRIMNQSMNTLNHHDNNRISNEHIRQSTSFVQYHTATVCAVGVAIALFIIVMRRLAIIFQEV